MSAADSVGVGVFGVTIQIARRIDRVIKPPIGTGYRRRSKCRRSHEQMSRTIATESRLSRTDRNIGGVTKTISQANAD